MTDIGLNAAGHDRTTLRYDVTIIVDRDGCHHLSPVEFAVAAGEAASARAASVVTTHAGETDQRRPVRATD